MATVNWYGVAGRRVMAAAEHRLAFSSLSSSSSPDAPILCGRGDKKTRRGKIFKGSYGNARPKKEKKIERIKDKIEVPRIFIGSEHQIGPTPPIHFVPLDGDMFSAQKLIVGVFRPNPLGK